MSTTPTRRTPEALEPVTGGERWSDDGILAPIATAEARRESIRFIDRVAHASPVMLYVFDLGLNRTVYCNPAVEFVLGYSRDDIQGMGAALITNLMHPDDRPMLPTLMARLAAASDHEVVESEHRIRHARGDWRWLAVRDTVFARDADGVPRQILRAAMDVTDLKLAEIALRESQRRFALATSAGRVVVWDYDIANDRIRTEPSLAELLGFAPSEREDRDGWAEFLHPADHAWVRRGGSQGFAPDAPRDADGNTPLPETEYRVIGRDGTIYWVADRGTVLRRPTGEPYSAVGALADITERKRAEIELRKVTGEILRAQDEERRRIASDLHDGVAQELTAITINLMRIEQIAAGLPEEARTALTATQALAERALRELRTLSYLLHPSLLELGGLPDAIRDYARGFAKRTGIVVDMQDIAAIGALSQDAETALYRVVQECLVNIQRHSGSDFAAIRLSATPDGVVLQVSDRGRGVRPRGAGEAAVSPSQIGVGIASMRERVRHLGGRLDIRSGPTGTTVTARLPGSVPQVEHRAP